MRSKNIYFFSPAKKRFFSIEQVKNINLLKKKRKNLAANTFMAFHHSSQFVEEHKKSEHKRDPMLSISMNVLASCRLKVSPLDACQLNEIYENT